MSDIGKSTEPVVNTVMDAVINILTSKNIDNQIVSSITTRLTISCGASCYVSFLANRVSIRSYYYGDNTVTDVLYSDPDLFDNVLIQVNNYLVKTRFDEKSVV